MKKLLTVVAIILCATCINAQPTQEWVQTYAGGSLGGSNNGIALDNAGNIYAAGSYYDGTVRSMLLLKYDAAGTLLWSQTYLPAGYTSASGRGVAVDGNGDVIVTGSPFPGWAGFTRKYDAAGNLLWSQSAAFSSLSIATDENNNIYLSAWDAGGGNNIKTLKYNAAGVQQWTTTTNITGVINRIIYKDGYVYVTGEGFVHLSGTPPGATTRCLVTVKYNAPTGVQTWAAVYSHADKISQGGGSLVADGTGNIYVTGFVFNKAGKNQNINWVTLKYNSAGTQQWVKIYDGNGNDYYNQNTETANGWDVPSGIALDNNGDIIVAGTSYTTTGTYTSNDMTTIKYSSSGSQLWVKTYDGPAHTGDGALAIATDASSNIYLTGSTDSGNSSGNSTTIKYNSSGTVQWVANYDGGATFSDATRNIRLDNSGNVYVGGTTSSSTTGSNSLLIKYSQGSPRPFTKMVVPVIENAGINVLKLYPNPATNQITLKNANDIMLGTVSVYDASGKMVYQKFIGNTQTVIDVKNFPSGVYYLRTDQSATAIKFVKQ